MGVSSKRQVFLVVFSCGGFDPARCDHMTVRHGVMQAEQDKPCERVHYPLVRYYRDCLAVQMQWARAVNVLEQKDVFLVPLSSDEQDQLGSESSLALWRPEAIELAKRFAAAGADRSLTLGALFLVGCRPATADRAERRFCAPLLEVSLTLRRELSDGLVRIEPEEEEFSINYSLIGELLTGQEEDLQDQLAELAELAPDFPIDETEFDSFWNGFRMIASELPISESTPPPAKARAHRQPPARPQTRGEAGAAPDPRSGQPDDAESRRLNIVDFYVPQVPRDGHFHLLPATAVLLGRRAGQPLSALRELDQMASLPLHETAFGCLFDPPTASPPAADAALEVVLDDALPVPLTRVQEATVRSARTAPLTVVTGPPGTGKSYTITAMVLDALLRGESVLIASQMDKAVQVVADQVERIAGRFSIVRSGGRAAQRRLARQISQLTGPRSKLTVPSSAEQRQTRQQFKRLNERLVQLEQRYARVMKLEQDWSESWRSCERLQPICSLPVHDIPGRSLRKSERLVGRARRALQGRPGWLRRKWGEWCMTRALRRLQVPDDWDASVDELEELLHVQQQRRTVEDAELKLRTPFPANLVWQEYCEVQQRVSAAALQLLANARQQRLGRLLSNRDHRAQLRHLATLLRRRRHDLKRELRKKIDPGVMLSAFPAWASTLRTLGEILPVTPAMFDLVIIDEASQCDPAFASVALLRGKRAVVVGDPHQLRHVCFLSRAREQAAFASCDLNPEMQHRYRYRRSLFDIAADAVEQQHFFLLDQHFRSHPHIIEFSNRRFYDGQLRIMTQRPSLDPQSAIEVIWANGRRKPDSSVNLQEVSVVADVIADVVRRTVHQEAVPSIGVVSPFREHVDAVREQILESFPDVILERYQMVVGTAHALQGDEKDIVLLTTSIDPDSHPASLRFLESPNLFNVAITRPRKKLVLVTSVGIDDLPAGLLRDYLHHATGSWQTDTQDWEQGDALFEQELLEKLRQQPVTCWPGFRSAGVRINIVAAMKDRYVAVLCDGDRATTQDAPDALTTHRILERAGWPVVRIPHRSWHADWYACVKAVLEKLQ